MKRIFRVLILLFIIILFIFLFNFFINKESNNTEIRQTSSNEEKTAQEEIKPDVTFTLTAIGDIMCHNTQYWDAYQKETDTYDFSYVFENVKDYIAAGDVSIANIETSFAGKDRGYSNYPVFNSPVMY